MSHFSHLPEVLRRAARQVAGALIGAAVVGYFAYYAVQGDRGLIALKHLQYEVERARQVLDQVRGERQHVENRASLLRPDNLDPDMLDERARLMLNFSRPEDVIIMLPSREETGTGLAAPQPTP